MNHKYEVSVIIRTLKLAVANTEYKEYKKSLLLCNETMSNIVGCYPVSSEGAHNDAGLWQAEGSRIWITLMAPSTLVRSPEDN